MADSGIPCSEEDFTGTLTRLLMMRGATREVAILAMSTATSWEYSHHDNWDRGIDCWRFIIVLPIRFYSTISETVRNESSATILELANELLVAVDGHVFTHVQIVPRIEPAGNFREEAIHWLNGEGINNQGRVRSNNIASRECDGLLFRSLPEIHIYKALKCSGLTFAPLPVFLRGGEVYRRLEPDFVIWQDGILVLLEIDGDTVHKETPAEAAERVSLFEDEGAIIKRLPASRCETPEKATLCVKKLIEYIQKRKEQR